ncbi:hypothetical protein RRG08_011251 [Elysia crispata]|uniref:Uncharacterized protein n=1 Tax=Elysia crispata TaxID=231223 RepID=A0AAE0YNA9_9GAST|nr:hypothetical protein RRG08_011251 [Elysia crispata]
MRVGKSDLGLCQDKVQNQSACVVSNDDQQQSGLEMMGGRKGGRDGILTGNQSRCYREGHLNVFERRQGKCSHYSCDLSGIGPFGGNTNCTLQNCIEDRVYCACLVLNSLPSGLTQALKILRIDHQVVLDEAHVEAERAIYRLKRREETPLSLAIDAYDGQPETGNRKPEGESPQTSRTSR